MNDRLVIAISGQPGAGTSSVAKEFAKRLSLKYFSPGEYFKSYSKERGARGALDVWRSELGKDRKFHKRIDRMQIQKARLGGTVICGKLSIYILKDLADFKIWIESPLEDRASRSAKRDRIAKKEAIKLLKEREKTERKEWKRIYGIDYFDQRKMADAVIGTSNIRLESTVEEIANLMNKMGTKLEFLKPFEKGLAKKMKKRGLTITVSGLSKSGKSTIAKSIAKAFKLRYIFAGEIQRQLAKENGISLERQVRTRKAEVDYEIDRKSLEFAMRGGVVIDARLSGWVAGDWADAKIFVKCSLEDRARRLAEDEGITIKEARELIRKRDEGDSEKYRQLYKIDQTDISIYDIVIDNSRLALNEARTVPVKLVKEFLKKKLL
jgi:cytidylate kinase